MNDMHTKVEIKDGEEKIAEVHYVLDSPTSDKKDFVDKLVKNVEDDEDVGFAGYKDREGLASTLLWSVYGKESVENWNIVDVKECTPEIEFVLKKCSKFLKKEIKIFIFPTVDKFIVEKMDGCSGFTPWKNTILIYANSSNKLKTALKNTVCHELCHAVALNFNERKTLADDFVCEGMAEHFREAIIGGERAPWTKAISKEKAKQILKDLKDDLSSADFNLYAQLFFGSEKYSTWSGYAIGYYLVEEYLKFLDKRDWNEIIKTPTSKIVEGNSFL